MSASTALVSEAKGGVLISIALFADGVSSLMLKFPVFAFSAAGMLGGVGGWLFAFEAGETDEQSWRENVCVLARRVSIGLICALLAYLVWHFSGGKASEELPSFPLLIAALIAAFPREAVTRLRDLVQNWRKP